MTKTWIVLLFVVSPTLAADAPALAPSGTTPAKPAAVSPTSAPQPAPPAALGYTREFSPKKYTVEDCIQKSNFETCQKLAAIKKSENNFKEALPLAKKACELKPESCAGLYSMVSTLGPDAMAALKKFLEEQCVKHAEACNEVSLIYESQKDYTGAIDFARKYYLKYQKGNFTKFSYLYGDKNEAFAASLNECTLNNSECVNYIRTMGDHPQFTKLISFAEQDCIKKPAGGSCLDTGLHYNKKAKYVKSLELWSPACKSEVVEACIYLMGSRGVDPDEQLKAYKLFCNINGNIPIAILNVKKMNCQNPYSAKDIPNQLRAYSEYELRKAEKLAK